MGSPQHTLRRVALLAFALVVILGFGDCGPLKTVYFPAGTCDADIQLGTFIPDTCDSIGGVELGVNAFPEDNGCVLAGKRFQDLVSVKPGDCVQLGDLRIDGLYVRCFDPEGLRAASGWVGPAEVGDELDESVCQRRVNF